MSKLNNVITLRVDRLTVERQCTQRRYHLGTGNHIYKLLTLKIHNFEVWSGIGEFTGTIKPVHSNVQNTRND